MFNNEEEVQCPYNFSHVILKSRMAGHLVKCRQQYPLNDFSTCPFNSTHDVPTAELQFHVENCGSRKNLDSFLYVVDKRKPDSADSCHIELPTPLENWDEVQTVGESYAVVKNQIVENQPIFRIPVGKSKAQRKAFFKSEVDRFKNLLRETDGAPPPPLQSYIKKKKKHESSNE